MRSNILYALLYSFGSLICLLDATILDHDTPFGLQTFTQLLPRDLPIGTCNAQTPCPNGACCSTISGLCGYSPSECGAGNCSSHCDAKAQCGQYGATGQQNCPLNVCCSKFGFCGETSDFCGTDCQAAFGGCGDVKRPSCGGGSSVNKRTIGYYESWSNTRQCQKVAPEDLNLNGFTHINFAFAFFDPASFQISPMDGNAASLYSRFTGLKSNHKGLQTWISVGGWSFTDPGPTRTAFSDMASSFDNRQKFINGLKTFMDTYGFDGVDLDWEYPAADDRGGVTADTANYVNLVQDIKAAFGSKYGVSMTLPTSYWYLQHFDLSAISDYVDWFNLMAYDLHGTWDSQSKFVGPYIAPHTNITEIDAGLDLLWRAGVDPSKVVMGEGCCISRANEKTCKEIYKYYSEVSHTYNITVGDLPSHWLYQCNLKRARYGRSFTLKDPSCNTPNGRCQFSGGANAGPCSNAVGILDNREIQDIIKQNNLQPVHDQKAGVKWITWDSNQWISYDDADTFQQKRDFANSRCLGGLMVWAMDQIDQTAPNGFGPAPGVTMSQQADANQMAADQQASITCYTTGCGEHCKKGTNEVTQMNGQPGQISTSDRCPKGKYRSLCCDDGTTKGQCQWRGFKGVGLSCTGGCADGETELTKNTNNHGKKGDQTCNGGTQSYCCAGFKPAPSKGDIKKEAADAAKAAAEAAAENAALDLAAKAFCRVMVPALLAPLELLEDLIPIVGEIADLVEIAATPAIIEGCVKGIEKEGKAEFKVFGKKHTLSLDKPTNKPEPTRPPVSSHEPPKTSDKPSTKRSTSHTTSHTSTSSSTTYLGRKKCAPTSCPTCAAPHNPVIRRDLSKKSTPPRAAVEAVRDSSIYQSLHKRVVSILSRFSLFKRTITPESEGLTIDKFMAKYAYQGASGVTNIIYPGTKDTASTSKYSSLGSRRIGYATAQLSGCTTFAIVSKTAVYFSHIWDSIEFEDEYVGTSKEESGYQEENGQVNPKFGAADIATFTAKIEAILTRQIKADDGSVQSTRLDNHKADFAGGKAYIMTPSNFQNLRNNPATALLFPKQMDALRGLITTHSGVSDITTIPYNPWKSQAPGWDDNASGKALFLYDPGAPKTMNLWFESHRLPGLPDPAS